VTKINEINIELSGNSQRYVNECCESESDRKIDGFAAHCCRHRGGVAIAIRRNEKANNKWAVTTATNTPTMKNGGRGKNAPQPWINTPSAKKTWADIIKSGGINVQIVLGNSNLRLTILPMKKRGERRGGAAWRLGMKAGAWESSEEGQGTGGLMISGRDGTSTKGGGGERGAKSGGGGLIDWLIYSLSTCNLRVMALLQKC
jgi:hypothetical protein